jgi:starch synthase
MFVASEVSPLAKTGGLGDVLGSLPPALARLGLNVTLVLPAYQQINKQNFTRLDLGPLYAWSALDWEIEVWQGILGGCTVYLLGNPILFDRPGLYSDHNGDFGDNLARFSFFCRAVIALSKALELNPQILHVHDWQTALLPAILSTGATAPSPLDNAATVLTIHNLAYQGIFPYKDFFLTGLHQEFNNINGIEYWGNISLLKAGLLTSHAITTVSPSYAQEIKTSQFGYGMEGILADRQDDLYGILNGVDYAVWSPEHDPWLPAAFSADNLQPKKTSSQRLLKIAGLPPVDKQPILGMVGRLTYQKGLDILVPALDTVLSEQDIRVIILGTGEPHYEHMMQAMTGRHPNKICLLNEFSEEVAHLIQAGSDMLLMPSIYEPCGLSQLYALRYGTIPIVRNTGGLHDTVHNYSPDTRSSRQGTGFAFDDYSPENFLNALRQALKVYKNGKIWQAMMRRAMKQDFSWQKSAYGYLALYNSL